MSIVPGDLLLSIAAHLDNRADVFSFSLTSSRFFTTISSVLYRQVTLYSAAQCSTTLKMLRYRPEIARHVRELIIKPGYLSKPDNRFFDSEVASAAVRDVATAKVLDALVKFTWDFDDLPFYDDMWFALRVCCGQLRYIGTSMGTRVPTLRSHLFDFVDLQGFSLYLKRSFFESHLDIFSDDEQPISRRFWNMLMDKCPNLQELVIDGVSPFPVDARTLSAARWPNLRRLVLGDIAVDWLPGAALTAPEAKSPFIEFLEAHGPTLQSLGLSRSNVSHTRLATMSPDAVKLRSFTGTLEQLHSIPHMHKYLECVAFREPLRTREVTALAVAGLLQKLTSLTKLRISFMLHSMYDSGNLLRSLVASCPKLIHLELACGHKPSFQLEQFAKTIRGFSKLRVLHLTIIKYPGDENISRGASLIAMTNPRIQDFSLAFLPPAYPFGFPFPLITFLPLQFRSRESGSFTLTCDRHGLPQSLRAFERRRLLWPFGLGQSYRTRRYINDLRPMGSPSRKKPTGLAGILALLSENSSGGEELRMMVFCLFLVFLAFWGFYVQSDMKDGVSLVIEP